MKKKGKLRTSALVVLVVALCFCAAPLLNRGHNASVNPVSPISQDDVPMLRTNQTSSGLSLALSQSIDEILNATKKGLPDQPSGDSSGKETPAQDAAVSEPAQSTQGIPQVQSDMPYMIVIYIGSQRVVVYEKDDSGLYSVPAYVFTVSTGLGNNTIRGTYQIQSRWRWLPMHGIYCQYVTQWSGNYLFHSVMYSRTDPSTIDRRAYSRLGSKASAGCIRMTVRDAKWIYDNCARGTYVISTNDTVPDGTPGSLGVPPLTLDVYWDPTDPDPRNPYLTGIAPTPTPVPMPTPALSVEPSPSAQTTPADTSVSSETPAPSQDIIPSENSDSLPASVSQMPDGQ